MHSYRHVYAFRTAVHTDSFGHKHLGTTERISVHGSGYVVYVFVSGVRTGYNFPAMFHVVMEFRIHGHSFTGYPEKSEYLAGMDTTLARSRLLNVACRENKWPQTRRHSRKGKIGPQNSAVYMYNKMISPATWCS